MNIDGGVDMSVGQADQSQIIETPVLLEEDLHASIFRWRPLLGETGDQVDMRLLGGAKLGPEGLDLSSPDAFSHYTLPTAPLAEIIQTSGEISVRLWVKSTRDDQGGPARIFTWSKSTDLRNLTLGQGTYDQENNGLSLRVRLDLVDDPSARQGQAAGDDLLNTTDDLFKVDHGWYHLVAQYRRDGHVELWVNGDMISRVFEPVGLSSWDPLFNFALGQELSDNQPPEAPLRSWSGIIAEVAIYPVSLSRQEILTYVAGGAR